MQTATIWQAADRLVARYGDQAPGWAAWKARDLLEQGQIARRRDWIRIREASLAVLAERGFAPDSETSVQ